MAYRDLTQEQIARARELWAEGKPLGEIAREIGCGVYDLSPWLYADELRAHIGERNRSNETSTSVGGSGDATS